MYCLDFLHIYSDGMFVGKVEGLFILKWSDVCWYGILLKEIPVMLNYDKSKIIDKIICFHSKTVLLVFLGSKVSCEETSQYQYLPKQYNSGKNSSFIKPAEK